MTRLLLGGIALYRRLRRRLFPRLVAVCAFTPTCSRYAETALLRHGVLRGGLLAVWRIARCNPWSGGGYDPVPARSDGRADPPGTPPDPERPAGLCRCGRAHGPVSRHAHRHR